jgi:hypothetical protein
VGKEEHVRVHCGQIYMHRQLDMLASTPDIHLENIRISPGLNRSASDSGEVVTTNAHTKWNPNSCKRIPHVKIRFARVDTIF